MEEQPFDPKKVRLVLHSHGLKRSVHGQRFIIPNADFYVDCRGIAEHGMEGFLGFDVELQNFIRENSSVTLHGILTSIRDGLRQLPYRRRGTDPISKPYEIYFMCAWGMQRSVATKHIIGEMLKAEGYDVTIE